MLEKFLEQLKERAEMLGIDVSELVETYERRFNLGLEAGFSVEEIIERFGKVEEILVDNPIVINKDDEIKYNLKELTVQIADNCDVNIEQGSYVDVEIDEDMEKYYTVINDGERIVVKSKEDRRRYKRFKDVTITLPKGCLIKKTELTVVNGDINCEVAIASEDLTVNCVSANLNFTFIKAKKADFSMVSGDIEIDTFAAIDCEISTVSGDVDISEGAIRNLSVSTISGDINIDGVVDKVDSSSVSGEISINHKGQKTSLKDALESIFRF